MATYYTYHTPVPSTECTIINFQSSNIAQWLFPDLPLQVDIMFALNDRSRADSLVNDATLNSGYRLVVESDNKIHIKRFGNTDISDSGYIYFWFADCEAIRFNGIEHGKTFPVSFIQGVVATSLVNIDFSFQLDSTHFLYQQFSDLNKDNSYNENVYQFYKGYDHYGNVFYGKYSGERLWSLYQGAGDIDEFALLSHISKVYRDNITQATRGLPSDAELYLIEDSSSKGTRKTPTYDNDFLTIYNFYVKKLNKEYDLKGRGWPSLTPTWNYHDRPDNTGLKYFQFIPSVRTWEPVLQNVLKSSVLSLPSLSNEEYYLIVKIPLYTLDVSKTSDTYMTTDHNKVVNQLNITIKANPEMKYYLLQNPQQELSTAQNIEPTNYISQYFKNPYSRNISHSFETKFWKNFEEQGMIHRVVLNCNLQTDYKLLASFLDEFMIFDQNDNVCDHTLIHKPKTGNFSQCYDYDDYYLGGIFRSTSHDQNMWGYTICTGNPEWFPNYTCPLFSGTGAGTTHSWVAFYIRSQSDTPFVTNLTPPEVRTVTDKSLPNTSEENPYFCFNSTINTWDTWGVRFLDTESDREVKIEAPQQYQSQDVNVLWWPHKGGTFTYNNIEYSTNTLCFLDFISQPSDDATSKYWVYKIKY